MLSGQEIGFIEAIIISITGMTIVMIELSLLALLVVVLSKVVGKIVETKELMEKGREAIEKQKNSKKVEESRSKDASNDENMEVAAVMVAIAEESGLSLEEINFKSIKRVA